MTYPPTLQIQNIRAVHYETIGAFRNEAVQLLRAHCADMAAQEIIQRLDLIIESIRHQEANPLPTLTDARDNIFKQLIALKAPTLRPPPEPEDEVCIGFDDDEAAD